MKTFNPLVHCPLAVLAMATPAASVGQQYSLVKDINTRTFRFLLSSLWSVSKASQPQPRDGGMIRWVVALGLLCFPSSRPAALLTIGSGTGGGSNHFGRNGGTGGELTTLPFTYLCA